MLNDTPAKLVVLTDGDRGCWYATRATPSARHMPALPVDAIEPTGAGDAFTAALLVRLLDARWEAGDRRRSPLRFGRGRPRDYEAGRLGRSADPRRTGRVRGKLSLADAPIQLSAAVPEKVNFRALAR